MLTKLSPHCHLWFTAQSSLRDYDTILFQNHEASQTAGIWIDFIFCLGDFNFILSVNWESNIIIILDWLYTNDMEQFEKARLQ